MRTRTAKRRRDARHPLRRSRTGTTRFAALCVLASSSAVVAACASDTSTGAVPTSVERAAVETVDPPTTAVPATTTTAVEARTDASTTSTTPPTSTLPDTTTPTTAPPATIPAGTTLRVGDQLEYLQTVLELAGEGSDFPYEIEYAGFIGGPPLLQAFQAGAVDVGTVGSTQLIFAQAQDLEIHAVAGWVTDNGSFGLVTAPGVTDVESWADLGGKTVAYAEGTALEAALLQALEVAGLELGDITPVNVPLIEIMGALQSGSSDAGVLVEPLTSGYLAANPTAAQVDRAGQLTDRSSFLIASDAALADPAKEAALADYITRLVRAFAHLRANPEQLATAVYVEQYGIPADRALAIVAENGGQTFLTLPGEILQPQQHLADLLVAAGRLDAAIDAVEAFDDRFNAVVDGARES